MERIFQKINRYFYGKWHIAVLDFERGLWTNEPNIRYIPYFKAENANGRHILIQPLKDIACFYMLVDDINWSFILKHHIHSNGKWKPGRMVVETSPGNYQVWIHSKQALSTDDKLYWLKKLCSDPGAHPDNRWGRCPGFRNRKARYRNSHNQYPLSKLVWVDWRYIANVPKPLSTQPWGGVCQNIHLSRMDYIKDDPSATDFSFVLALLRTGHTEQQIEQRIIMERPDFRNHQGEKRKQQYIERTIKRAKKIINNDKEAL